MNYDRWKTRAPDIDGPEEPSFEQQKADYEDEQMNKDYWKGYIDAIRHADTHLQCVGDDRTVRECRKVVLRLCGVEYEPREVVPIPAWPPEEYVLAALPNLAAASR